MMLDATGDEAVKAIRDLGLGAKVATQIVEALQAKNLIARCSCPTGWGKVRDSRCPIHGRDAVHTVGPDVTRIRSTTQVKAGVAPIPKARK